MVPHARLAILPLFPSSQNSSPQSMQAAFSLPSRRELVERDTDLSLEMHFKARRRREQEAPVTGVALTGIAPGASPRVVQYIGSLNRRSLTPLSAAHDAQAQQAPVSSGRAHDGATTASASASTLYASEVRLIPDSGPRIRLRAYIV